MTITPSWASLVGTLIAIDRVGERGENGNHLWYSGKYKTQGGNAADSGRPGRVPGVIE